jgi:hypothetical protein
MGFTMINHMAPDALPDGQSRRGDLASVVA